MVKGEKLVTLNDLCPDADIIFNGEYYDQETEDTGVIYCITNVIDDKSYIGKAFSYVKNGNQKIRRHGAKDRFYKHWMAAYNNIVSDCPVFYEALRNSNIDDWFVYTIKVCSKKHLKEWETKMIKKHKTYKSKYGYNYFVGDNKPNDENRLKQYQMAKADSNVKRAIGGALKKREQNKNLPANINYRRSTGKSGKCVNEGYFVQIKLNGKLYNKAFMSNNNTMEEKLEMAKEQLEQFKKEAAKNSNQNTPNNKIKKKKKAGSKSGKKK